MLTQMQVQTLTEVISFPPHLDLLDTPFVRSLRFGMQFPVQHEQKIRGTIQLALPLA